MTPLLVVGLLAVGLLLAGAVLALPVLVVALRLRDVHDVTPDATDAPRVGTGGPVHVVLLPYPTPTASQPHSPREIPVQVQATVIPGESR